MGAWEFYTIALGRNLEDAFTAAQEQARWEHGHGGYSGTIAEKPGAVLVGATGDPDRFHRLVLEAGQGKYRIGKDGHYREVRGSRDKALLVLQEWLNRYGTLKVRPPTAQEVVDLHYDKWDECIAVEVTGKRAVTVKRERGRAGTHDKVFAFTGYASC